jgi:hypothetical protein
VIFHTRVFSPVLPPLSVEKGTTSPRPELLHAP